MEPMTIFAISGCILSAGIVYVVLKITHSGESQALVDQLLKVQAESSAVKKNLLGYTKYTDYIEAGLQAMTDQLKSPVVKVLREYAHTEKISKDKFKLKADATVIVMYAVEYSLRLDVSPAGLVLTQAANGLSLKLGRPTLLGEPLIKTLSHHLISSAELPDVNAVLVEIHSNFSVLARTYGAALTNDESVRAECKLKALECLRDSLAKQPGVVHVPAIFVDFK